MKRAIFVISLFLTFYLSFSLCQAQTYKVKRVIDGDTILLSTEEKVRLIGINAPEARVNPRAEKQAGGGKDLKTILLMEEESTRFVQGLVRPGDQVRIEFEFEKRDQYGRLLGYVYLSDGRMLNEEILRMGYAIAGMNSAYKKKKAIGITPNSLFENWLPE